MARAPLLAALCALAACSRPAPVTPAPAPAVDAGVESPVAASDRDGDGIVDDEDRCPEQAMPAPSCAAAQGCPDDCRVVTADVDPMPVQPIHFAQGKATLDADQQVYLDDVARILLDHPELLQVRVLGYSDDSESKDPELSERRAEAVSKRLVDDGVEAHRLLLGGKGSADPVAATAGLRGDELEAARAQNRRVELSVAQTR